jgi:hypothetical protein
MNVRLQLAFALVLAAAALASGCETIKPYEKEYLLSPIMDDAGVSRLQAPLMSQAQSSHERLAAGAGSSGGSSCPTCGG